MQKFISSFVHIFMKFLIIELLDLLVMQIFFLSEICVLIDFLYEACGVIQIV